MFIVLWRYRVIPANFVFSQSFQQILGFSNTRRKPFQDIKYFGNVWHKSTFCQVIKMRLISDRKMEVIHTSIPLDSQHFGVIWWIWHGDNRLWVSKFRLNMFKNNGFTWIPFVKKKAILIKDILQLVVHLYLSSYGVCYSLINIEWFIHYCKGKRILHCEVKCVLLDTC